jgi:sugar O-acyltransferase (sialic acid O-acetyltransferase NeuD family)
MNNVLIWGGKSKARILIKMLNDIYKNKYNVALIFDQNVDSLYFSDKLKFTNDYKILAQNFNTFSHFITCIGGEHGYARVQISKELKGMGLKPISLISQYSILDDLDKIGEAIQVMPGAIVHKYCTIGDYCILNTNSTIDHESKLGNGVHVMGGASIAGRVEIGDYSTIGTNATILPNITLGNNVFVGAGAVVTRNVPDGEVVIGSPAKKLRNNLVQYDNKVFIKIKKILDK